MSNEEWFVREVAQFDTVLAKALATGKPVLVYLYGNWTEGTCQSWCGDCRDADAIVREQTSKVGGILIEVPVGVRDDYKGKPENPWRVFDKTKITAIPTLIRFTEEGEKGRLVERDCVNAESVAALLN